MHFLPDNSKTVAYDNGDGVPQLPSTDLEKIQKLVSDTGGNVSSIEQVFRMGSRCDDGKPHSLKVQCSSTWTKRGFLTGQQRLRNKYSALSASGFFASDDFTEHQWDEDKKLRELLKQAHEANPAKAKALVIREGKIVEKVGNKQTVPFSF